MKDWIRGYIDSREVKDELMVFLKQNHIYGEPSACGNGFHMEILCTESEAEIVNEFLDSLYESKIKTVTEFVGYNEDGIPCFESYEVKL